MRASIMSASRAAVMFWVLAILIMDSWATKILKPDEILNVTAGTDVLLPCPCDEKSVGVLWQVEVWQLIIVNLQPSNLFDTKHPDESYKKRTDLFWHSENQNCSLLLREVSMSDQKTFECMVYGKKLNALKDLQSFYYVQLNVEETVTTAKGELMEAQDAGPTSSPNTSHMGVSVGVPLSVILVILAALIVALLIRRQRRTTTTMVVIQDPNLALPMLKHSPV